MTRSLHQLVTDLSDPARTHYEALDVAPGDSMPGDEMLKAARNAILRQVHPDRCKLGTATALAARATEAYTVLADWDTRRLYDASLLSTHVKCDACAGVGYRKRQQGFKAVRHEYCGVCSSHGWIPKERAT